MTQKKIVLVTGAGSGIGRAVAEVAAQNGHCVYASMRSVDTNHQARVAELETFAKTAQLDLHVLEMDVQSVSSCQAAVAEILVEKGRIDVVVNNAGMLMTGMTEAFSPEQLAQIFDTNAISWLRVNQAVLPAMRRQRQGLLIYIGSTTAHIVEPFMGPYVASKAAGEALAEVMGFEISRFGVESVIVVPGAFTTGTEHFAQAQGPSSLAVVAQYGELPNIARGMGTRLQAIDAANGGAPDVRAVGEKVSNLMDMPHGTRPARVVVDGQKKGVEDLIALHRAKQTAFFEKLGIEDLFTLPDAHR